MARVRPKRSRVWAAVCLAFASAFLMLGLGVWGGVEAMSAMRSKGCINLSEDVAAMPEGGASETVRFLAFGDAGTGDVNQAKVAATAARLCREQNCDFMLMLGDNIYERGVRSLDDEQFVSKFERPLAGFPKPVYAVLGNHDVKGSVLAEALHSLRSEKWRMPNYRYSFGAGPARFFALNTACRPLELLRLGSELDPGYSGWTFVFGHHNLYGSGPHGDADVVTRWYWQRNLEDKVDFYLSGHEHQLERLRLPGRRADYIVSGSGGKNLLDQDSSEWEESAAESVFNYRGNGLVWFTVSPIRTEIIFYDAEGKVLYRYVKRK